MLTLGIDLSTLTPAELQQLLRSARDRGEVILAERLQAELSARRRGPVRARTPWAAADIVDAARIEAAEAVDPAPPQAVPLALALAAAAALSVGAGWWLTRAPPRAEAAAPAAAVAAAPIPLAPPQATVPPAVSPPPVIRTPHASAQAASQHAIRARAAPARRLGPLDCGKALARADRMVCADRGLSAQHRTMRAAYERAVAAGADRLTLDRAQARWRQARDRASTPRELAQLYAQRIAALRDAVRR